jgi:hypothetical protein
MSAHVFEHASSGRSKCRGCGVPIQKGELRFGERLPNPYADGEMVLWFHPMCAAFKRPDAMLQLLAETPSPEVDREVLKRVATTSAAQKRLQRIDGAERAKASQANCRHCHERIEKGAWRIRLVFFEEGRFHPSGFIHFTCSPAYFENHDALEHLFHFSPALTEAEREELRGG